jgi:hypothetical protein
MLQLAQGNGLRGIVSTPLIMTLLESAGYLQDQGWHQTAQLMKVAAGEIESLNRRVAELETHLRVLDEATAMRDVLPASNQNMPPATARFSRR